MTSPEAPAATPEVPAVPAAPKAAPKKVAAPKAAPKKAAPKKAAPKKAAPKKAAPKKAAAPKAAAPKKVDEPGMNKTQAEEVVKSLAGGSRLEKEQKRLGFSSVAGLRHAVEAHVDQKVYRKAVTKGRAVQAKKLAAKK